MPHDPRREATAAPTPDLDEQLDRLESVCPRYLKRLIQFLRTPGLRWFRIVAGVLLIIGGLLWFLPILGLEMIPIGLMLLALEVPMLRRPVARMIDFGERRIRKFITSTLALAARLRGIR